MELRSGLQAQLPASLDLSGLVDGSAGVHALVLLLVCQDAEAVVASVGAHLVLAALDQLFAVSVPFDLRQRSADDAAGQSAGLSQFSGDVFDVLLQAWSLTHW